MRFWCYVWTFWLCLLGTGTAWGQGAVLRGHVTDAETELPIAGANVVLDRNDVSFTGTATGADGAFRLSRIPAGAYGVTVSFLGFQAHRDTLTLHFDQVLTLNVTLEPETADLNTLVVESDAAGLGTQAAGLTTIRPAKLARVPMPDVNSDLMSYLITMPGVVSPGDRGGQLFVRGGTPAQNLVLIDGIPVYQPFHIVGFYSAFPADILSNAEVYAGGFNARYGGRVSSVIDVSTRNGSKERFSGSASVAPFLSSVRIEGPVEKGKLSMLGVVRASVIERVAPELLQKKLPYRFGDRFLKLHAYLNNTSSASFTLLHTFDGGDLAGDAVGAVPTQIGWRNTAVGGKYVYLPTDFPALVELNVSSSKLDTDFTPFAGTARKAAVRGINAHINFAYLLGPRQVHFGMFVRTLKFQYTLERAEERGAFVTEGGVFIEAQLPVHRTLEIKPGFRLHGFPSQGHTSLEPRLQFTWRPEGLLARHTFHGAWGIYRQEIVGLNDERDVSGVFTAWGPSPDNQPVPRAIHWIGGWQTRLQPWLHLGLEGYTKTLSNLSVFTGNTGFRLADGAVRGLDARLEITQPFFYAHLGYTWASVWYTSTDADGSRLRFRPSHDRRHHLNAMARWVRGAYALSLRWSFGTGLPFTQVAGFFNEPPPLVPDATYRTNAGVPQVLYSTPFEGRLPAYHRLDVSVERTFAYNRVSGKVQAGLINAYNRANVFYYDLWSARRIDQLPLIPSVGLKVNVR